MDGRQEATVMGPPPFSSPDPATDAQRMLPLEDGTSAHQAALDAEEVRNTGSDYNSMSPADLKALAEERDLTVEGTGANGNVKKSDLVAALTQDDTADYKAADWKREIAAVADQDALDELAQKYEDSGASYSTVEAAFDARADELENQ